MEISVNHCKFTILHIRLFNLYSLITEQYDQAFRTQLRKNIHRNKVRRRQSFGTCKLAKMNSRLILLYFSIA